MTKSILRYFIIVLLVALTLSTTITSTLLSQQLFENTKQDMLYSLKLLEYSIDYTQPLQEQIEKLNPLAYSSNTRISIIDLDGNVLADTYEKEVYDDHSNREEIIQALQQGQGYAKRQSDTTGEQLLYVAYLSGEYVIRLSIPYHGLSESLHSFLPSLGMSTVISFIIACLLSKKLAVTLSKPMMEICDSLDHMSDDYRFKVKKYKYKEYNTIEDTIQNLSHRLRKSLKEVKYEKSKVKEILKQMNEGFVLLDEDYRVLTINAKAISILGDVRENSCILDYVYHPQLIKAIENDVSKQMVEIKINECYYACYISRKKLGTTIIFVDITVLKENEKMRSEFFSNVSHELKTPMTAIRGYSDLLSQGLVQDEDMKQSMLLKIQDEVNSMLTLINDILMLSRIEYTKNNVEMIPLKMKAIVEEVLESYEVEISNHQIEVVADFEEMTYVGNHQQIYTLLNNIIGNAIKYNVDGGRVDISMVHESNALKIIVKDTGIGIPLVDQARVFERFYRVDKGRSKQRGGTGLGLAIVKHIVSTYKGTISLKSELSKGTTIEIVLPEQEVKAL